jgi:uncharacterized protein
MPEDLTPTLIVAALSQLVLLIVGGIVLWRVQLSADARRHRRARLPVWPISWFDFGVIAVSVMLTGLVVQVTLGALLRRLTVGWDRDLQLVVQGGAFQAGLLLGVIIGVALIRRQAPAPTVKPIEPPVQDTANALAEWPAAGLTIEPALPPVPVFAAGAATFFAAVPVLFLVNWIWTFLLEQFGFPTDKQELVELFARAESPTVIIVVTTLAVVVAPVAEEVIFRAGLFRFLRTRIPRLLALLLPAVIFAALHGNLAAFAPLVVLGIAFALAYERTGRILVPIIGHALFNLNTILLLLAGVTF